MLNQVKSQGYIFSPLDDGGWVKWDYFAFVTTPEQIDVYLFLVLILGLSW